MAEASFAARAHPQKSADDTPSGAGAARHEALERRPAAAAERDHARMLNGRSPGPQPAQRAVAPNRTGLPDRLKSGIEALSGVSLDGIRVHYNSSRPAQLAAHAFAQGSDIHLAPGQERHLPHEAWHVVQQKQGRVRTTLRDQGTPINDEPGLEAEADRMGAAAARRGASGPEPADAAPVAAPAPAAAPAQLAKGDGIVIKNETEVHATRSDRSEVIDTLSPGTAAEELGGRTPIWVKIRVVKPGKQAEAEESDDDASDDDASDDDEEKPRVYGWVAAADTARQPGIVRDGQLGKHAPVRYTKLDRAPFVGEPSGDDISQGGLGDCWLLAPLAAIADTGEGKTAIKAMISPKVAAERYNLRFFVPLRPASPPVEQSVTIDNWFAGSAADDVDYAQPVADKGIWPLIVEKAAADLEGGFEKIDGGFVSRAFTLITGKRPKVYAFTDKDELDDTPEKKTQDELKNLLAQAHEAGKPISAHVPSKKAVHTVAVTPADALGAFVAVPNKGVVQSTISITYATAGGQKSYLGANPALSLSSPDEAQGTAIFIAPASFVAATSDATVTYEYTNINGVLGRHVYQVHSVDADEAEVDLCDPHDTTKVKTLSLEDLETEYDATFFIGDASAG
jgi:hypothetical protein